MTVQVCSVILFRHVKDPALVKTVHLLVKVQKAQILKKVKQVWLTCSASIYGRTHADDKQ